MFVKNINVLTPIYFAVFAPKKPVFGSFFENKKYKWLKTIEKKVKIEYYSSRCLSLSFKARNYELFKNQGEKE